MYRHEHSRGWRIWPHISQELLNLINQWIKFWNWCILIPQRAPQVTVNLGGVVGVYCWVWTLMGHLKHIEAETKWPPFPDAIFKCIFIYEIIWISIKISLKFVPRGPINNIPALVQIMAWRRPGDKPLSEPMMVSSLTHICVTRPQWVKTHWDDYWGSYWQAIV